MPTNVKEIEDRIGYRPGTDTPSNHTVERALLEILNDMSNQRCLALRQDLRTWIERNEVPPNVVRTMQPPTLAKCYAIAPYIESVRRKHANPQLEVLAGLDEGFGDTNVAPKANGAAGAAAAAGIDPAEVAKLFDGKISDTVARALADKMTNITLSEKTKGEVREVAATAAKQAAIEALAQSLPPREITIVRADTNKKIELGLQHRQFDELLDIAQMRDHNGYYTNIWLSGVTGGGKTTACVNLFKALGMEFEMESGLDAKFEILGNRSPTTGEFIETAFFRRFTQGGGLLLDEIDTYSARALLAFNSGAANNVCQFPHGLFHRHKDFLLIAAGNTWGLGATNDYTGRNKIDAATLNRFPTKLEWEIDERLERSIAIQMDAVHGTVWHDVILKARSAARRQGLKIIISPRDTFAGVSHLQRGASLERTLELTILAALDKSQRAALGVLI